MEQHTGYALIYRWKLKPGKEDEFVAAWGRMTALIRESRGGRGSRLHQGEDGLVYAYAQWPDRETADQDAVLPAEADDLVQIMQGATEQRLPTVRMRVLSDLLVAEGATGRTLREK